MIGRRLKNGSDMLTAAPSTSEPVTGAAVRIKSVSHRFGSHLVALDGIDLDIAPGTFVAVLGPSGCGKSTLLRLTAGLARPTAGSIEVDCSGDELAYVFQDAHLLPWRNVLQNVALPLELRGVRRLERLQAARQAIDLVGLADAIHQHPAQLSGGMRMRTSLARAMAARPRLLLLDEPFAALDEITRQRLDEELLRLWRAQKMTVLFVTHSTAEAAFLAQRGIVLSPRPGRVVADVAINLPEPRDRSLRMSNEYAAATGALFAAMESSGALR